MVEYYAAMKISKPSPHIPSCMNLTNNLESKKPNTKSYIYCMLPFTQSSNPSKINLGAVYVNMYFSIWRLVIWVSV